MRHLSTTEFEAPSPVMAAEPMPSNIEEAKRRFGRYLANSALTDLYTGSARELDGLCDEVRGLEAEFLILWNTIAKTVRNAGGDVDPTSGLDLFDNITWAAEQRAKQLRDDEEWLRQRRSF